MQLRVNCKKLMRVKAIRMAFAGQVRKLSAVQPRPILTDFDPFWPVWAAWAVFAGFECASWAAQRAFPKSSASAWKAGCRFERGD